jgi:uncharacterized repeat protein (TIGR01451 family)
VVGFERFVIVHGVFADGVTKASGERRKRRLVVKVDRKLGSTLLAFSLLLPGLAWASPQIKIDVVAEKEQVLLEDGDEVIERVPAETILPGETLIFTVHYANSGTDEARSVVVTNPIPVGTVYVPDSADGVLSEVAFSVDDGKSYADPAKLSVEAKDSNGKLTKRPASAEEYTHVRWVISEIPAGGHGELAFRARVK